MAGFPTIDPKEFIVGGGGFDASQAPTPAPVAPLSVEPKEEPQKEPKKD